MDVRELANIDSIAAHTHRLREMERGGERGGERKRKRESSQSTKRTLKY